MLLPALLASAALLGSGAPDPTFNGIGLNRLDTHGQNAETGVAIQRDRKIVVTGEGPNSDFAYLHRLNPDGSLDEGFGTVTIDGPGTDHLTAVLVQDDGKILAAGSSATNAVLYRFTAAGEPDEGFGTDGKVTLTPNGQTADLVFDVAERGGTIVAAGSSTLGATTRAAVWRRDAADGSAAGSRTIAFGDADTAASTAIQPDGKILVAGTTNHHDDGFVSRLDTALDFDPAFHGGTAILDAGAAETAISLALQPDGKVVVVGRASVLTRVMVTRLTTAGEPDPAFNGGASQFLDTGLADFPARVLIQPDGKILIAGSTDLNSDIDVFRLTAAGRPDETFGGGGLKLFDAGGRDTTSDAALQADGDIVIAGTAIGHGIVARLLGDPLPLTVRTIGSGTVLSEPNGLACGPLCVHAFDVGTSVTLTAQPDAGSHFDHWTGCAATCTIELHAPTTVTATFAPDRTTTGNPGATAAAAPTDTTPPRITGAHLLPSRFRAATGTRVRYALSETAATTIAIRRGSRTLITLQRPHTTAGENVVSVKSRTLKPGRYRMLLTAADAAGNRSAPVTLGFAVRR